MTQQQVADALGLHLTNYNKLENGVTDLTLTRMNQLAEILHVQPSDFITANSNIRRVTVQQHVEAGYWADSTLWPEADRYEVAVPDYPEFRGVNLYAAETRGPSMNKRYPEKSALIYTSIVETQEKLESGKRYIVEIERADGLREATVKTLQQDENGEYWLVPESNDPRYQAPIPVRANDGETIRIVGRVRFSVLRED